MHGQVARTLIDIGDLDLADDHLREARSILAGSGEDALQASTWEWTGVLEVARGRYDEAIVEFARARASFARLEIGRGVALQDYHRGRALTLAKRYDEAIEALTLAERELDREADGLTYGRALLRLGQARSGAGEDLPAIETLAAAASVMTANDAPFYVAIAQEELATVLERRGDRRGAIRQLVAAVDVLRSIGSPRAPAAERRLTTLAATG